jgi:hypothetical protein
MKVYLVAPLVAIVVSASAVAQTDAPGQPPKETGGTQPKEPGGTPPKESGGTSSPGSAWMSPQGYDWMSQQGYGGMSQQEPGGAPSQGYGGAPSQGYGAMPPQGYGGMPPQGYGGMPPQGYGAPPQGYEAPPQGYGAMPSWGPGGMPPWGPGGTQWMQSSAAANKSVLDARLAGMKAGLKLTPDQEKLWGPFEAAVRDASKARTEALQKMMQMRQSEWLSPVDRLKARADRMAKRASELEAIADAAKPLFDSLDPTQKGDFELLGRVMFAPAPGDVATGPWSDRG